MVVSFKHVYLALEIETIGVEQKNAYLIGCFAETTQGKIPSVYFHISLPQQPFASDP